MRGWVVVALRRASPVVKLLRSLMPAVTETRLRVTLRFLCHCSKFCRFHSATVRVDESTSRVDRCVLAGGSAVVDCSRLAFLVVNVWHLALPQVGTAIGGVRND